MKKLIFTIIASTGIFALSFGQYVDQSLLFSQQYFGSTARSKAMGNAFGAIGGDFSSLSINPAGIAIYQRSEAVGTLNLLNMGSTETTYQGQISNDSNNNFNFRNIGYIMANPSQGGNSGLVSFNFGIGMNKLNNFNQNISVSKMGSPHSRMDAFAENTNGINTFQLYDENNPFTSGIPWESKMAWETFLIDVSNPNSSGVGNQYQSILFQNELVNQNQTVSKEGFNNEYVISFGANFNHKLYVGATMGIQDLYYNESKTYSETGDWGSFDYYSNARTRGTGYNLKLGMIVRPIPALRLGLALHTPTMFNLNEEYSSVMKSNLQNVSTAANGTHSIETPLGKYNYKMESPTRAIASIAYQFGSKGMISADYEYVDYSKSKMRQGEDGYNFSAENTDIRSVYQSVGNIRIGGEYKPLDAVSLRAGYELFGNPYKSYVNNLSQPNQNYSMYTYNLGFGYRIDNVYIDVAYTLGKKTDFNYMYQLNSGSNAVQYNNTTNGLVFTLGFKL